MDGLRVAQVSLVVATLAVALHAAGGRLAPRMFAAPLVYLATRRPVLVGWVVGAVGMYAVLAPDVPGAPGLPEGPRLVLSVACGLGFSAMFVGAGFLLVRALTRRPTWAVAPGEQVLLELPANHLAGQEVRGGRLVVTEQRLGFVPHRFNVQLDPWSAARAEVGAARPEGLRLMVVETARGEAVFVVPEPAALAEQLTRWSGR